MSESKPILAPISAGELIDKITILRIKFNRFGEGQKRRNVQQELMMLERTLAGVIDSPDDALSRLTSELMQVNTQLWDLEDSIRECDRAGDFGSRFVQTAKSIYQHNDRRCAIKRQISELLGSPLIEEKEYRTDQSARS